MILLRLFYEFAKTGLFAVGGGLATLPFLYAMSEKTGWFTYQDVADMIAVSESTPGAMGVNMSTYVGFTTAGVPGAVLGSLGLIFPSIVIIIVISKVLQKFKDSRMVQDAFYGLRPASTGLIASAGLGVAGTALLNVEVYAAGGGPRADLESSAHSSGCRSVSDNEKVEASPCCLHWDSGCCRDIVSIVIRGVRSTERRGQDAALDGV